VLHAVGSDVQVFDRSIRHQKAVFVVVVLSALRRTIYFMLYKFLVIRMNTLEDEVDRRLNRFARSKYMIRFFRPNNVAAGYLPAKTPRMT
jgi:hypothetical protein